MKKTMSYYLLAQPDKTCAWYTVPGFFKSRRAAKSLIARVKKKFPLCRFRCYKEVASIRVKL